MNSQLCYSIVKRFSGRKVFGFSFQDVVREFPEKNRVYLSRILAYMVDQRMVCKLSRNNYLILPLDADPETYTPDVIQVAKYRMQNRAYYLGYASALRLHGLTFQPGTWEYVVTSKPMKTTTWSFGGHSYQFIKHSATRFFGFSSFWINQLEKAMVSDLEKTIVDIATKPQLCGGITELGNAMIQAKDRTEHDKLFYYFARNMSKCAKKRFLFLTELLNMEWTDDHDRMMEEIGSGISLLDPLAPDQGSRWTKFGLKINVDPARIKDKALYPHMF